MGETVFAPVPTAVYGIVSLMAAITYFILVHTLIRARGQAPTLARALGTDRKGMISPGLYALAIPVALVAPAIAILLFATVVALWIVPDFGSSEPWRSRECRPGRI